MSEASACSVRRGNYLGWQACFLENAYVRLAAVPDVGGRIMAYDLGPYPFFYVNPALAGKLFSADENQGDGSLGAWKNYGGAKTWPAPQGWDTEQQWHGPPDAVLDTGRYRLDTLAVEDGCAVIAMTSPQDPRTGLQITRRLALQPGSSRVTLELTFRNIGERTLRWSIWDVAQLRAERQTADGRVTHEPACTVTVPLNPESRFPRGFQVMFGSAANSQWQTQPARGLFVAPYRFEIGKVGLDSTAGWIAFHNGATGYAFAEQFAYDPAGEYPDGGATVEVWTTGTGQVGNMTFEDDPLYHVETEVLSPLRTIPPGETASFSLAWGACRCEGPVVAVNEAGCLSAPLTVEGNGGDEARVRVVGGVFDAGTLALVWRDARGRSLEAHALGRVDPLTLLHLDGAERVPARAQTAAVQLTVEGASRPLTLGETQL